MSQGPLCPNLTQKVQREVSQMSNWNFSCMMLLGGLSVNLNHLKSPRCGSCVVWSIVPYWGNTQKQAIFQKIYMPLHSCFSCSIANPVKSSWVTHMTPRRLHSTWAMYALMEIDITFHLCNSMAPRKINLFHVPVLFSLCNLWTETDLIIDVECHNLQWNVCVQKVSVIFINFSS